MSINPRPSRGTEESPIVDVVIEAVDQRRQPGPAPWALLGGSRR
jgi:hypothetical protein